MRQANYAWDGPYEVHRKISEINYAVTIMNMKGKKIIVHTNNCKQWHQADASVLRIVVAAEENGEEDGDKLIISGDNLSDIQWQDLHNLLDSYKDILKEEPGLIKGVHHSIDTGNSLPCRTMPYRICPAWRDAIRKEISTLLKA